MFHSVTNPDFSVTNSSCVFIYGWQGNIIFEILSNSVSVVLFALLWITLPIIIGNNTEYNIKRHNTFCDAWWSILDGFRYSCSMDIMTVRWKHLTLLLKSYLLYFLMYLNWSSQHGKWDELLISWSELLIWFFFLVMYSLLKHWIVLFRKM